MPNFGDLDLYGNNDYGYPSGGSQSPEPSGFEKIKTTIQPGAAFDLPDNSKVSGSSMMIWMMRTIFLFKNKIQVKA